MGQHTLGDESRWKGGRPRNMEANSFQSVLQDENDDTILQEIVQGLNRSSLRTDGVKVVVTNAIVFLRGQVDNFDDFIKIEEFVNHIPGVEDVRNELQVRN